MNRALGYTALVVGSVLVVGLYLYSNSSTTIETEHIQIAPQIDPATESAHLTNANAKKKSAASNTAGATDYSSEDNYQYVDDRLAIMHDRRPGVTYDPAQVAAAMARQDAWKPLATPPQSLPLTQEEMNDGREFIDFDSLKIETLVPGDTVKLAIEDTDQEYDVNIDNVEQQDESRITWSGHIKGADGQSYHVSFTKGSTLTVGGVDTPDGHYVIQAHGDKGWVASSGLLFKNHVDPIIPPEEPVNGQSVPVPDSHTDHTH